MNPKKIIEIFCAFVVVVISVLSAFSGPTPLQQPYPSLEIREFKFDASGFMARESDGRALVNIRRSGILTGAARIGYATSGGTAQFADYTYTSGFVNWADGEGGFKTIYVPLTDDKLKEPNETVNVYLNTPTNGVIVPPNPVPIVILDND